MEGKCKILKGALIYLVKHPYRGYAVPSYEEHTLMQRMHTPTKSRAYPHAEGAPSYKKVHPPKSIPSYRGHTLLQRAHPRPHTEDIPSYKEHTLIEDIPSLYKKHTLIEDIPSLYKEHTLI